MKYLFIILFLGVLLVPLEGQGSAIRTKIVCRSHVGQNGDIDIDGEVVNIGEATAYHLSVTVFIADWAEKLDDLGDNLPGGKIGFQCRYAKPDLKPGKYIAVVRISFEEQIGIPHRVYHFSPIIYQTDRAGDIQSGVSIDVKPSGFNSKVIGGNKGKMDLILTNRTPLAVSPVVSIYPSDGFHVQKDTIRPELMPGERMKLQTRLTLDKTFYQDRTYFVVLRYEQNGFHYSQYVEGQIGVEDRPVYFKWYLLVGSIALVIFSVVSYYLNRASSSLKLIL